MRRGDNIPPISDYAHWNEDAYAMWYQENKYDMQHWDEEIEDDGPYGSESYYEPEPDIEIEFDTEEQAREMYENPAAFGYDTEDYTLRHHGNKWIFEGYSKRVVEEAIRINRQNRNR